MDKKVSKIVIKLDGITAHYEFLSRDGHVLWFYDLPKIEQVKVLNAFAQAFQSYHNNTKIEE